MANGKAMTVGEMASLFLDPATPDRIDAFDGSHFGPADADLKVNIATPNCMYQLLAHPNEIGIVRAYILGDFDVEGIDYADPYPAMRKLISLSKYVKPLTPASIARVSAGILSHGFKKPPVPSTEGPSKFARIKRGLMPHTEKADSETVSFHYDMSNEFYADFLGPSMTYTCAVFDNEHMSLEDAQANKLRLILDKLDLKPGERLLDIGCGWGFLLIEAAKKYKVHGTGITLSYEQYTEFQKRIKDQGLEDYLTVELMDYRDLPKHNYQFDRVVSVGMLEHVGRDNYQLFLDCVEKVLKPGGLFLLHFISALKEHPGDPWIKKYIFPGGTVPSLREILNHMAEDNFHTLDIENLRLHYNKTLLHWEKNFRENIEKEKTMFDESFLRMWELYLSACAATFHNGIIDLHQILMTKGINNDLPMTRWY